MKNTKKQPYLTEGIIICTDCGEKKEMNEENFGIKSKLKSGFANKCKKCTREYNNKRNWVTGRRKKSSNRKQLPLSAMTGNKVCYTCEEEKPVDEFGANNQNKDGKCGSCRTCMNLKKKKDHHKSLSTKEGRDKHYDKHLRKYYDITIDDFYNMQNEQEGVCKICGGVDASCRLSIDHCHTTGEVRGLLCGPCNKGIGLLKDNVGLLKQAIVYLEASV